MRALTKSDIKAGLRIVNKANPEWGTWTVKEKYDDGIWKLIGRRNQILLFEDEAHFYSITDKEI